MPKSDRLLALAFVDLTRPTLQLLGQGGDVREPALVAGLRILGG